MSQYCPNCAEVAWGIQPEIWWCPRCGTLIHPTEAAWFQSGQYSTPFNVRDKGPVAPTAATAGGEAGSQGVAIDLTPSGSNPGIAISQTQEAQKCSS